MWINTQTNSNEQEIGSLKQELKKVESSLSTASWKKASELEEKALKLEEQIKNLESWNKKTVITEEEQEKKDKRAQDLERLKHNSTLARIDDSMKAEDLSKSIKAGLNITEEKVIQDYKKEEIPDNINRISPDEATEKLRMALVPQIVFIDKDTKQKIPFLGKLEFSDDFYNQLWEHWANVNKIVGEINTKLEFIKNLFISPINIGNIIAKCNILMDTKGKDRLNTAINKLLIWYISNLLIVNSDKVINRIEEQIGWELLHFSIKADKYDFVRKTINKLDWITELLKLSKSELVYEEAFNEIVKKEEKLYYDFEELNKQAEAIQYEY